MAGDCPVYTVFFSVEHQWFTSAFPGYIGIESV